MDIKEARKHIEEWSCENAGHHRSLHTMGLYLHAQGFIEGYEAGVINATELICSYIGIDSESDDYIEIMKLLSEVKG